MDLLGLTLLLLPLLDCAYDFYSGHSVFFRPLTQFSVLLAVYVYLMYYEKLVAWLLRKHLGLVCKGSLLRAGAEMYRFHVDMGRVEEYLSELQASSSDPSTTMTAAHIAVKAVGVAMNEMRHMHGVLLDGHLYRAPRTAVDVSVTESSGAGDHGGIFLHNVTDVSSPAASISTIAKEVASNSHQHSANMSLARFLWRFFRPFFPTCITEPLLVYTNSAFMACLLTLGVNVCPFGAARVVSVLSREDSGSAASSSNSGSISSSSPANEMDAHEVDFSVLPMTSRVACTRHGVCVPPVTVTLGDGGVKFIPVQHQEKKKIVRKFRVLNVSVCLHEVLTSSPGCTLQERQEFIARIKSLLNNPKQLFQ
jgi:hypothetical protein